MTINSRVNAASDAKAQSGASIHYIRDSHTLAAIDELTAAGFALHYLHPKSKRPIGDGWSEAPVATTGQLRASHQPGNNLGVRLGNQSRVGGGYLHVLDVDIRVADLADETWAALTALFPNLRVEDLPCVASGSGGNSRHLYFITDKPFRSKKLWVSEGKHRTFDAKLGRDVWHYDSEIELFGSDKQLVLPPSIHPDTGKPYTWLREFDFAMLDLGIGPFIPTADIERLAVAEHSTFAFENREPLTFTGKQLDRVLDDIPVHRIDDRDDWVTLGQALHHQFGGSDEGFELWMKHSARGSKFLAGSSRAKELRRYRGFGRNRRKPVTMASVVEWAQDARTQAFAAAFDDLDDRVDQVGEISDSTCDRSDLARPDGSMGITIDFVDLLGGDETPPLSDLEMLGGAGEEIDDDALASLVSEGNVTRRGQEWISLLDVTQEGAIKPTLHNVELIVANDPRLVGLPQLNEFTQETVQRAAPGSKAQRRKNAAKPTRQLEGPIWHVSDPMNGELWSSARDFAVRSIFEAPVTQGGYGVKMSDRDLKAATVLVANNHPFHPVREYLSSLTWDGRPRVERLFIDYLGEADDSYTRDVARLMMVAGVARVFEPGCKWDFAVIIEGGQGRGKSTFIRYLGKHWASELEGNFQDGKEMVEKLQGSWILEMPELSGFSRADVRNVKAFISRQFDKVRLAYEARATTFARQCVLIGSTNDSEYLLDETGGRRFLPIECRVRIDTALLRENVDQLWAEAYRIYRQMRESCQQGDLPLYLSDGASARRAELLQESRRVESAEDGHAAQIAEWLDRPISTGALDDQHVAYRNDVCLKQIWIECLDGSAQTYGGANSKMVGRAMLRVPGWQLSKSKTRIGTYGNSRFYTRGGDEARAVRLKGNG